MLKIAICDDELLTIDFYMNIIQKVFHMQNIKVEITGFTDSGKLLSELYNHKRWNIFFLDIDMPLIDGLTLGSKIRELDPSCYLIYISVHKEYVYDSLKNKPFRFIPKDEFKTKISSCIEDLVQEYKKTQAKEYILIETTNSQYKYKIQDIMFIKSLDKYIYVILQDGTESNAIRYKISDIEQQLRPHGFIRIHKSYLVNATYINSIKSSYLILDNHCQLPVSRYRLPDIKATFRRLTL